MPNHQEAIDALRNRLHTLAAGRDFYVRDRASSAERVADADTRLAQYVERMASIEASIAALEALK